MDPISFITEITSTVVANLWEDPKESPSAFLRQQTQEQMQKHFMLIPELLGTTAYLNNVDVHNPNGGDFEDEDWKLYRQLTQSQSDAMRRRKADKRRHEGTGDGLSSFPADIDFDVHVDYPMKRAKPTFQDGMFCNNVGDVDLLNMLDEPEFEKHLHMNKMSFLVISNLITLNPLQASSNRAPLFLCRKSSNFYAVYWRNNNNYFRRTQRLRRSSLWPSGS